MDDQPAAMNVNLVNSSTEDLYWVKGSPGLNLFPVLKAGLGYGSGTPDPEDPYTLNWTYSPDPNTIGSTSLTFECKFDDSGGLVITSSKTGSKANQWKLETNQEQPGPVYLITFTYSAA